MYRIKLNDDNLFDLYLDGVLCSSKHFIFNHLEAIAKQKSVDLGMAWSESGQLAILQGAGVDVEVEE